MSTKPGGLWGSLTCDGSVDVNGRAPLHRLPRWLIEVNASPSLTASSQEDYEMKCQVLEDTLHVVDMEGR